MVDVHLQNLRNMALEDDTRTTYWAIMRYLGVGAIFVALIVAYAWLHTETLNINYQIEQLKKENMQLKETNAALRAEYSALIDPEKIDRQARQLGLTNSNHDSVRVLDLPAGAAENLLAETFLGKNKTP